MDLKEEMNFIEERVAIDKSDGEIIDELRETGHVFDENVVRLSIAMLRFHLYGDWLDKSDYCWDDIYNLKVPLSDDASIDAKVMRCRFCEIVWNGIELENEKRRQKEDAKRRKLKLKRLERRHKKFESDKYLNHRNEYGICYSDEFLDRFFDFEND